MNDSKPTKALKAQKTSLSESGQNVLAVALLFELKRPNIRPAGAYRVLLTLQPSKLSSHRSSSLRPPADRIPWLAAASHREQTCSPANPNAEIDLGDFCSPASLQLPTKSKLAMRLCTAPLSGSVLTSRHKLCPTPPAWLGASCA